MAGAVIAAIVLTLVLPDAIRFGPPWLLPVFESLLLIALIAGDPGKISRYSTSLRATSITLVVLLALSALASTAYLIDELIDGTSIAADAGSLMAAAVPVWFGNVLAFALLYWELDSRGPVMRAVTPPRYPDFAFPQHTTLHLAPAGWRPRFVDYFYVSVTNSIAFSPTDTMPLAWWAKLSMALQSIVSFALVGLVIARAVNVF